MFGIRTNYIQTPFSPTHTMVLPEPEPEVQGIDDFGDPDPYMEEKKIVMAKREKKMKDKTRKNKGLPGQRLLKRLAKEEQLENSLVRVVKNLH
jgi:hypothetical protein